MERADNSLTTLAENAPWGKWGALGLASVLLLTLTISLANPSGWLGSDDSAYLAAAEHLLQGEQLQRVHHHYARMAMIVPIAVSVAILGATPVAVWIPSLLASLVAVALVAWIARILWGWREGLLAALIVALVPYFRILSTAGFPDVHGCMWTASSLALAIFGLRSAAPSPASRKGGLVLLLIASGFCVAIATLTKILAAPLVPAILLLIWCQKERPIRTRLNLASFLCLGGLLGIVIEGLFFQFAAGDFFFNLHAHQAALGSVSAVGLTGGTATQSAGQLALDRLTMMLHPNLSGWGTVGVAFWVVMVAGLFARQTRWLAMWASGAYLVLALCPVGAENGSIKLNPVFHGRHILSLSIPFALCAAFWVGKLGAIRPGQVARLAFPTAFAVVLALAVRDRNQLRGFVNRPTARVGKAIQRIVETGILTTRDAPIFMTPSMYWRYHSLFPVSLQDRLRVCTPPDAPDWWKKTVVHITDRLKPLPPPSEAFLVATPTQLTGKPEQWDYGVALPPNDLDDWRKRPPRTLVVRMPDRSIRAVTQPPADRDDVILVLGGLDPTTKSVARR